MKIRSVMRTFAAAISLLVWPAVLPPIADAASPQVTVYKTPTCGCCKAWVEHLRSRGFEVVTEDLQDLSLIKQQHRIPKSLHTCHTAVVDGYVVEGHVPASDVVRLLSERPKVAGIAVPGMPIGSPGMEVRGRAAEAFDTVTFTASGTTAVFERHQAAPPSR